MTLLSRLYKKNINGIILTLAFHVLVFAILFISQLKVREEYKEPEIMIDFPVQQAEPIAQSDINKENNKQEFSNGKDYSDRSRTNVASSRSASQKNKSFDDQYQKELEQAQNLLKDVSRQLEKEIPTLDELKMPEASKVKPEEMKDKIYSGESNIEYFLENRFHIRLPIPVYLAEGGGKVKVNIVVDRLGNVLKADPIIEATLSSQILSYAKTAAFRTKFNPDPNAPNQQNGYISYNFIPQK
jgi:hypothetical protein